MESLSVQLFAAWKELPTWWTKYWGVDWKETTWFPEMKDAEWTQGLIAPFIITSVAPKLGCKPVRLEVSGEKEKRTRADYRLLRDSITEVYIEHEIYRRDVYEELKKLLTAPDVRLKAVVTYGTEEELAELVKDIHWRVREKADGAEWMLIGGICDRRGNMESPDKWTAYRMTAKDNSPTKL